LSYLVKEGSMSMFSLMRNVGQGSRQQDLQGEFKIKLQSSCSDIVVNFISVKGLKLGLILTGSEKTILYIFSFYRCFYYIQTLRPNKLP
jgi:hypothetical protein